MFYQETPCMFTRMVILSFRKKTLLRSKNKINEELEESQEKKITTSNPLHSWVGRHTRKDYY